MRSVMARCCRYHADYWVVQHVVLKLFLVEMLQGTQLCVGDNKIRQDPIGLICGICGPFGHRLVIVED